MNHSHPGIGFGVIGYVVAIAALCLGIIALKDEQVQTTDLNQQHAHIVTLQHQVYVLQHEVKK